MTKNTVKSTSLIHQSPSSTQFKRPVFPILEAETRLHAVPSPKGSVKIHWQAQPLENRGHSREKALKGRSLIQHHFLNESFKHRKFINDPYIYKNTVVMKPNPNHYNKMSSRSEQKGKGDDYKIKLNEIVRMPPTLHER